MAQDVLVGQFGVPGLERVLGGRHDVVPCRVGQRSAAVGVGHRGGTVATQLDEEPVAEQVVVAVAAVSVVEGDEEEVRPSQVGQASSGVARSEDGVADTGVELVEHGGADEELAVVDAEVPENL